MFEEALTIRQHTIQVSDAVYQLLLSRSIIEGAVPDEVADRLLASTLRGENGERVENHIRTDTDTALEAVHRLTTLFADVEIEQVNE